MEDKLFMNIQRLEFFLAVANNLSFTEAAEKCHIAQTAMSRQIKNLEDELRVKLFTRNNRHVSLTNEGKEFYWYATHILEIYNESIERMEYVSRRAKYNLKIGLGPYENYLLSRYLKDFRIEFPQVDITCYQFNYEQLSYQLTSGTIDVMLCIDHCADRVNNAETFKIYNGPWGIICPQEHPLSSLSSVTRKEMTDEVVICMSEYNYEDYLRRMEEAGAFPSKYIRVNTYTAKVLFVQAGYGIAMIPEYVKSGLPRDVSYIRLSKDPGSDFVCAYNQGKHNHVFKDFIDFMQEKTAQNLSRDK